jgi:XapX domain-containing protein
MKLYVASLGAGLLVGILYGLLGVRSPAPPVVALVGLLGILLGEQAAPVGRRLLSGCGFGEAIARAECRSHVLGQLPANVMADPPVPADRH